jgi:glycyl-tRNA synthetase beta chain
MAEFLLELFSEEIPARMQAKGADDLRDLIVKGLDEKGLTYTKAEAHSTPRRITVVVDGLPLENSPPPIDKKGPRIDAAQQALDGFLKSIGQSDFSKCVQEESPKGTFWYYREAVQSTATAQLLNQLISDVLFKMSWPKSMRWKYNKVLPWVRPLKSIAALFDGKIIAKKLTLGTSGFSIEENDHVVLSFSNTTQGHRFLSPGVFEVKNFADYTEKLKAAHVILSRAERKAYIAAEAQKLAATEGLKVNENEGLLEEIVGLVEWPVPLVGTFEKEFLEVPQEVLISTMRGDQKYIALLDSSGKLANKFVVIANTITEDGGKNVVAGNEKVLRARLSDAKFFWDQDRKKKLDSRIDALGQITFHQKLGTVKDKVARLEKLAAHIAKQTGADEKQAARAALLAKADLTSGVVFQFPEVQGIMGRYYALHDKETPAVAQAIADHYKPVGANDSCPTEPLSICTALADKLDTLAGFFAIDEKPTGSKDPFALRRAALGIIRIILENNLRLPLVPLFEVAYNGYTAQGLRPLKDVTDDLVQFFTERLKVALKDQGIRHDLIDAVLAAENNFGDQKHIRNDDVLQVYKRAYALKDFLVTEDGKNLLAGYKRAANIVKQEEKKSGEEYYWIHLREENFFKDPEIVLWRSLVEFGRECANALQSEDFSQAMGLMAELRPNIDAFFSNVHINDEDQTIRFNRLALLRRVSNSMELIADFSKIEG